MKTLNTEQLFKIVNKLGSYKADLKNDAVKLFENLGYDTSRKIAGLESPEAFNQACPNLNKIKAHWSEWEQFYLLFLSRFLLFLFQLFQKQKILLNS